MFDFLACQCHFLNGNHCYGTLSSRTRETHQTESACTTSSGGEHRPRLSPTRPQAGSVVEGVLLDQSQKAAGCWRHLHASPRMRVSLCLIFFSAVANGTSKNTSLETLTPPSPPSARSWPLLCDPKQLPAHVLPLWLTPLLCLSKGCWLPAPDTTFWEEGAPQFRIFAGIYDR